MSDTVDQFIDVNKRLFAMCSEQQAKEHIASLSNPDAKALAQSLWTTANIERQMATSRSPVT